MNETTAYYWRYDKPYAARFCDREGAERFLEGASDLGQIAPDGLEPVPGVEYEDLGHDHCFGDDCRGEGDADG